MELAAIYWQVFSKLGITVEIKINSRKILAALAEACGGSDDGRHYGGYRRLDKIGLDKVKEELLTRGLDEQQVAIIVQYLDISGSNTEKLNKLKELVGSLPTGAKGIEELEFVIAHFATLVLADAAAPSPLLVDFSAGAWP